MSVEEKLQKEIERCQRMITYLQEQLHELDDRNYKLHRKLRRVALFLRENKIVADFIFFILENFSEEYEDSEDVREDYYLTNDC